MSGDQQRRLTFGIILVAVGLPWSFATGFSASQGYYSSLVPFFFGVLALTIGVYLLGRFVVVRRNDG